MKVLTGINIQWPWSELLLSGKKTVETRSYPLPDKFRGVELALIQTPGRQGHKSGILKAQIVGLITFDGCFQYETKEDWLEDYVRHQVREDDPVYCFTEEKQKWGWTVSQVSRLIKPVAPPRARGIIYASNCRISL